MKVVIIGAGAGGLMCATDAVADEIVLIDQNEKIGKKLYITGKGRCNVTNDCNRQGFFANIVNNPKFLMSAYSKFNKQDTMYLFESYGTPLKVERGGRVFPKSDKSSDIIKAFSRMIEEKGVKLMLHTQVNKILTKKIDDKEVVYGVSTNKGVIECDRVVLATGGKSYTQTGSDGTGFNFARKLGHKIIEPKPALIPLLLDSDVELAGLALKNVEAKIIDINNKVMHKQFGEMLFTHKGASGPIILSLSSYINKEDLSQIKLSIDLKPALNDKQLDERLLRDFKKYYNKDFSNALNDLLPSSLIPEVIYKSNIDPRLKVHQITKEQRSKLRFTLKNLTYNIEGLEKLDLAIVTSGGVDTKEINPKTMESKLIKGLFFAGEVIDVDALTGGYNIQIALSTGHLAGISL